MGTMKDLETGIQHIGIPTDDLARSVQFYEELGFHKASGGVVPESGAHVAFMELGNLVLEIYENDVVAGRAGAIDHFAINVTDIEAVFARMQERGARFVDAEIRFLPFWENGVRFFTILGPNEEKVEFNQYL